jgi:hypothetical protein
MHELPDVKLLLKTELDALRTQMTRQTEAPPENVAAIDVFDGAQTVEQQRQRKYAHRPSTAARHRSSPARAGIEDGIANRPSKVRDPL